MGLKARKHFMMLKQRHERKNIGVGVENFLSGRGILLAMKQFRNNDTSDGSQSHREMMVQVQCGQSSRLPPVRVFLVCLSIKVCLKNGFLLVDIPSKKYFWVMWDMDTYRTGRCKYNKL